MRKIVIMLYVFIPIVSVLGEGYQVNLQGNRQVGMGHAGVGLNNGSSGVHFNPGALAKLSTKFDFQVGGSLIFANNTFQKESPSEYIHESDNPMGTPFYVYGAFRLSDKWVAGLGITTPYGNTLKWGDQWDGRFLIQDIAFKSINIQPTLSYSLTDKLSLGAGFILATGDVSIHKALPVADSNGEGQAALKGSTINWGYNLGIFYEVNDQWSLGVDYRSKIAMKLDEGKARFKVPASLAYNEVANSGFPSKTGFEAELPLPANLIVGVGFKINPKLTLAADIQMVFWSAYDTLSFDFEQNTTTLVDQHSPKNFNNTLVYRIGAEYKLSDRFIGRVGLAYDSTPVPEDYLSPETPGTNKINLNCGISVSLNPRMSLDLSLQYIKGEERTDGYKPSGFYGTYNVNTVIPGFGLTYAF